MKENLLQNVSTPKLMALLEFEGGMRVTIDALNSNAKWAAITVWIDGKDFSMGWNGSRLSWVEGTKQLWLRDHTAMTAIEDALRGLSPTACVFKALEQYND